MVGMEIMRCAGKQRVCVEESFVVALVSGDGYLVLMDVNRCSWMMYDYRREVKVRFRFRRLVPIRWIHLRVSY